MPGLRSRLGVLAELRGPREAALFLRVSAFAACVPLLMRLPLPRIARLLRGGARHATTPTEITARLPELVGLAHRAWRPLVRPGCMTRGLTLYRFLRRAGLDVELCFGLEALRGAADGHCWLLRDGEVFLERTDPRTRFVEMYRLPPSPV